MHNEYYKSSMDEKKFVNFIRTQLINNKKGIWNYNPIYEKIIQRKDKTHVKEDIDDLNESVLNQDIPRISVLLAIGTKADEILPTGETNLYLCSKRGLTNSARILAQNFCDTNFTNSQHENTFGLQPLMSTLIQLWYFVIVELIWTLLMQIMKL